MKYRFMISILLLSFITTTTSSQTLEDIVKKHNDARGGIENIKAVKTIEYSGKMTMMGKEYPMSVYQKRPASFKSVMKMGKNDIIQAYDGKIGWQIIPMAGTFDPIDIKGKELQSIQEQSDMDGMVIDWKEKGYKLEIVGKEKLNDQDVFHLKIIRQDTTEHHIYLDAKTYLEVQNSEKMNMGGKELEIVTTLSDYRKVEKLMIPFSAEVSGPMQQKVQFEKILINKPMPDSIFAKPKVKEKLEQK